ncbi:MAG: guanylate kinase [Proteobacteria bacterium]|nr:guanylate kinase [Pseudomonadota bacterium]
MSDAGAGGGTGGRRGRLTVIAAPSGTGKTSLVKALMAQVPTLAFSVSHTTRKPRPNEVDGRDYHFVSPERFRQMIAAGEFLEHASVFDNYYGTSRAAVEAALARGQDLLLEIDWQGAQQVRAHLPEAVDVFILPPSRAALEARLRGRQTDSDEVIARRLRDSVTELSRWAEFRYVVVNDRFETALADLERIVRGAGQGLERDRPGLAAFAAGLVAG